MNSQRMTWPIPNEDDSSWYDQFLTLVNSIDSTVYTSKEDRNNLMYGGGTVAFNAGASPTLTWSASITILSTPTGFTETIAAGNADIQDGQFLMTDLVRSPTSNRTLTTYLGTSVPAGDNTIVIAARVGSTLYFRTGLKLDSGAASLDVSPSGYSGGSISKTVLASTGAIVSASAPNVPAIIAPAEAGTVLTSNGAGVLPSFKPVSTAGRRKGFVTVSIASNGSPNPQPVLIASGMSVMSTSGTTYGSPQSETMFIANNFAGYYGDDTGRLLATRWNFLPIWTVHYMVYTGAGANVRTWTGLMSIGLDLQSIVMAGGSPVASGQWIAAYWDANISPNWLVTSSDGSHYSVDDTGVVALQDKGYRITLDLSVAGVLTTTIEMTTGNYGTLAMTQIYKNTKTTNIPTSGLAGPEIRQKISNSGTGDITNTYMAYAELEQNA